MGTRKKKYEIEEEPGQSRYDKFMFNMKRYWMLHKHMIELIDQDALTQDIVERFKIEHFSVISSYASCASSFVLPACWSTPTEKKLKDEIEQNMELFRNETKHIIRCVNNWLEQQREGEYVS